MRAFALFAGVLTTSIVGCVEPEIEPSPPDPDVLEVRFTVGGVDVGAAGLVFASTAFGDERRQTVVLENLGQRPFTLLSSPPLRIDGAASSFSIAPLTSVTVPPERPLEIAIDFRPDSSGPLSATVQFTTVFGDGPSLLITGLGTEGDGSSGIDVDCYDGDFEFLPDFDDLEPATSTVQRTIQIDSRVGTDHFACRFRGLLDVPATGTWTFFTTADDGVQLLIDGEIVVDDDGLHGAHDVAGDVALTAGAHALEVRYFEATGGEMLQVRWQGPTRSKALLPATSLRRSD